jgi:hypothetical protein
MQFLYPYFLFALGALAIPVIIHLFNFRRFKTVYFSNVRFLREVQEETAARSRIKHLLVLLSRILALSFLVFAFAQPFIPNKNQNVNAGKQSVSIYIDNSFSMNAVSGGRSLLDKAKQAAKEVAGTYGEDDRFQLLTNDFEGRHQRLLSKQQFLSMLEEVEPSAAVRSVSEIAKRQTDALNIEDNKSKVAYLLSDFQKDMGDFTPDSLLKYNLVPLAADAQANVYIDSCWFNEPVQLLNQNSMLLVRVRNSGEKAVEGGRLVLKLNGQTKSMADFNLEAEAVIIDTLSFVNTLSGWNKAELSIQDYPITYDDNYFVTYNVLNKVKVLVVNQDKPNQYLQGFFKDIPEFEYTQVLAGGVDDNALADKNLVVLDGLKTIPANLAASIGSYVADGGTVALFPAAQADVNAYNRFLNNLQANSITGFVEEGQDIGRINLQQNIYKDAFERLPDNMQLPRAKKYYTFSKSTASGEEVILALKDEQSFVSRYPYKNGALFVCASPLNQDYTDLPVHGIFVPLMYKMSISNIKANNIAYFIGDKTRMEINAPKNMGDKVFKMKGADVEFVPEQFAMGNKVLLGVQENIKKSGFYNVALEGTDSADVVALNFDRRESDLKFYNASQLKEKYNTPNVNVVNGAGTEVMAVVKELNRGTALWKLCLILTIIFFGIETLLLRFWKV